MVVSWPIIYFFRLPAFPNLSFFNPLFEGNRGLKKLRFSSNPSYLLLCPLYFLASLLLHRDCPACFQVGIFSPENSRQSIGDTGNNQIPHNILFYFLWFFCIFKGSYAPWKNFQNSLVYMSSQNQWTFSSLISGFNRTIFYVGIFSL